MKLRICFPYGVVYINGDGNNYINMNNTCKWINNLSVNIFLVIQCR